MAEQTCGTLGDRESKPKPAASAIAPVGVQLNEFLEDILEALLGNSRTRIPDLERQIASPAPPSDENAAPHRMANRIADEIEQNALQPDRVRADDRRGFSDSQRKMPFPRQRSERARNPREKIRHRKIDDLDGGAAKIELGHIQQGIEDALRSARGLLDAVKNGAHLRIERLLAQHLDPQADRLQRLAQVVACRGEESAARPRGLG